MLLGVARAKKEFTIPLDFESLPSRPDSGNFPDWRRVVSHAIDAHKPDRVNEIAFNAALLSRFERAATLLSSDKSPALRMELGADCESPALIRVSSTTLFLGLIMPMRLDYCQ